jgi:hypothetical protein
MVAPPQGPYQYTAEGQMVQGVGQGAPPAGQQRMAGGVMPAPRGNKATITIVMVVVVIVVAGLVVATADLYGRVSSIGPGKAPNTGSAIPALVMESIEWRSGIDTVSIRSVFNGTDLAPANLAFTIVSASGPFYSGAEGLHDTRGGPQVSVVFNDLTSIGAVTAGDTIGVEVVPSTSTALAGATLRVFDGSFQIGVVTLSDLPATPAHPTIVMQSGGWNNGNTTVSITDVINGSNLAPDNLQYTIETSAGPYYSGAAGANDTRGGPMVNVIYNDVTGAGLVTSGDGIRIQVTPPNSVAIGGASLKLFQGGSQIGAVTLAQCTGCAIAAQALATDWSRSQALDPLKPHPG